jgi:hypothetical protein
LGGKQAVLRQLGSCQFGDHALDEYLDSRPRFREGKLFAGMTASFSSLALDNKLRVF